MDHFTSSGQLIVAAASADITPARSVPLAGFAARSLPYKKVASSLEANALAVRQGDSGRVAVIVTLDTLFVGAKLDQSLREYFAHTHTQRPEDLLICASHTHYAPSLDETKPALGLVDLEYLAYVVAQCTGLIDKVVAGLGSPVAAKRGQGASYAAINRRRLWVWPHIAYSRIRGPEVVMAPNASGTLDPTIDVWMLEDAAGQPIALMWHYACHPTGYPEQYEVSPDFPGVVRDRLRVSYGRALPVLFFQGFAGDIRPRVPDARPLLKRALRSVLLGPSFAGFSMASWRAWANRLSDDVEAAFKNIRTPSEPSTGGQAIASAQYKVPLSRLIAIERDDRFVQFQRLRLGSIVDLVAVAAEPLVGLLPLVPSGCTATGYLGDPFGYWPCDRDRPYGGYEVRYFVKPFGLAGPLLPNLDALFMEGMSRLQALS